jgi:hypothetical protein
MDSIVRWKKSDIGDDGLPADFDICPLFHVATVETLASGPPTG